MKKKIHIIGAGLSGISCACRLAEQGLGADVILYEASGVAGGRCKSFQDKKTGKVLDNGTHMIMGANQNAMDFLKKIGSEDRLISTSKTSFNFIDIKTVSNWTVSPSSVFWIFDNTKRVKDSSAFDYIKAGVRLVLAKKETTIKECLFKSSKDELLYNRLWRPLSESILNTAPENASARVLYRVLRKTVFKGNKASKPYVARDNLSDTFINPATQYLEKTGVTIHHNTCLKEIKFAENLKDGKLGAIDKLIFNQGQSERSEVNIKTGEDFVVLAIPAVNAADVLQKIDDVGFPVETSPIVNVHYFVEGQTDNKKEKKLCMQGITSGFAHWLFYNDGVLSVTVSAADSLINLSSEEISSKIWQEISPLLADLKNEWGFSIREGIPDNKVIKEKRAGIIHSVENERKRAFSDDFYDRNILLSGDWTNTGLPCTIEGSIISGLKSANIILSSIDQA